MFRDNPLVPSSGFKNPKGLEEITTTRCVITQKGAVLRGESLISCCSRLNPRLHEITLALCDLADLLISPWLFVNIDGLLIPNCFVLNKHTPQSWHCLLLYPLKHYTLSSSKSSTLFLFPLTLQGEPSDKFPVVLVGRRKGVYFLCLTNLKFLKISLNFRGRKTITT
jgi:hypothetical protein